MQRLRELILGFLAAGMVTVGLLVALFGQQASLVGANNRGFETVVENHLAAVPKLGLPWVMWLGDSTIRSNARFNLPGYPYVVGQRLKKRLVASLSLAIPGLDSFQQYYLAGPFAQEQPTVMVLIANLRVLGASQAESPRNYLCQFLRPRELARAITLPFHARQMTLIDVLACPILATPPARTAAHFSDGLRLLAQDAPVWGEPAPSDLGRENEDRQDADRRLAEVVREEYSRRARAGAPSLRMLQAAIQLATEHGVSVLVVLTPIPIDRLLALGAYDPSEFATQLDVLRDATEAAGGQFLDLHNAIPEDEFRDLSGHFNEAGIEHMADLLEPVLQEMVAVTRREQ